MRPMSWQLAIGNRGHAGMRRWQLDQLIAFLHEVLNESMLPFAPKP